MRLRVLALLGVFLLPAVARAEDPADPPHLRAARERMVREQIVARGVARPDVIAALLAVPRHLFVPPDIVASAYQDHPLPIGEGQTISQPYIVALMTEALGLQPGQRVLEIGTGSGYQAAVLSPLRRRSTRSRSYRACSSPRRPPWFGPVTRTWPAASGTGIWAGPRRRPSTPSSSPLRSTTSRSP